MVRLNWHRIRRISKRIVLGVFSGLFNYVLYFIIPDYIYKFLRFMISSAYPEVAGVIGLPAIRPTVELSALAIFLILSCLSSLLSGSWFGYLIAVTSSSVFMFYAISLMNFGRISVEYQGVGVTVEFSVLIVVWFTSFILDVLGRAFDLIEREAKFIPTL
ncbi:MAG: hypothetical protein NDF55_07880 [archaeon GB-1867-005]|nr:hypothetical protein [Candidatus Culexmicrobium cathedralense]